MHSYRLTDRRRLVFRVILLCLLLAGAVFVFEAHGGLDREELWSVSRRFVWRGPRPRSGRVVVVGIDDVSLHNLALQHFDWPWPRSVHARLVDRLTAASTRVIAFDVSFSERDSRPSGMNSDSHFARALGRSGRVLLATEYAPPPDASVAAPLFVNAEFLEAAAVLNARSARSPRSLPEWLEPLRKEYFWSLPMLAFTKSALGCGFIDVDPDLDGIIRRIPPVQAVDTHRLYLHLGVAAAAAALGVPLDQITLGPAGNVHLGRGRVLPVDPDGRMLINFAGGATRRAGEGRREVLPSAFPYYSYETVLAGRVPLSAFRGKVVFVGAAAKDLNDVLPTPFGEETMGVEVCANVADSILAGRLLRPSSPSDLPLILLALTVLLCLALTARTPAGASLRTLGIAVLYLGAAFLLFARGVVLPVAAPLATMAICYTGVMTFRFATEQREQRRVRRFLERYVTRDVANRVLEDPEASQMGGRRREVTMLFSDIRGFTSMSEKLAAEVVIEILNEYFAVMVPIIEQYRGTINNFIGDAIFAFWGAPLAQDDQAERAVLTGIEMLESLMPLQARWRAQGLPAFEIGIGVHTGTAVIGNIGTEQRAHYTTIGDDVNIASRLESANSKEGTKFLISEAVYARVSHLIEGRRLPPLSVKNKAEPLCVYEVLGRRRAAAAPDGELPQKAAVGSNRAAERE